MSELFNMSKTKTKMKMLDAKERIFNFEEVALGFSEEQAVEEAKRCLNCKNTPCVFGCPIENKIPAFIAKIRERDFEGAYQILSGNSCMPAVCGRVCAYEKQCESKCTRGLNGEPVAIGALERFVSDYHNNYAKEEKNGFDNDGHKIAIIGSGPAGIACATELAKNNFNVTIFESYDETGGILRYGIPEYRLPKLVLNNEIKKLDNLNVKIQTNTKFGVDIDFDDLKESGFEAIFLGVGTGKSKMMGIAGEKLEGVLVADNFLEKINKQVSNNELTEKFKDKIIAVVGGGNVAMDSVRTAARLGASKVYIIYRRSIDEMPARVDEIKEAQEEGVEIKFLTNPIEILGGDNGTVKAVRCIKMELGEPDENGRRRPVEIEGSEFDIDADYVIMSIGNYPNDITKNSDFGVDVNQRGCIIINNETGETTKENVFAGGDVVTGAATVVEAIKAGKLAAKTIMKKFEK